MHNTTRSTALGVAACKGRAHAWLSALRPSPCWAGFVTTGIRGPVRHPVTLQAQSCCFGAICCEKYCYLKHPSHRISLHIAVSGGGCPLPAAGWEADGVLPPPGIPWHPALRGSCSHLWEVKRGNPKAGKSEINFLFTAVLITLIRTLLRQLRIGGFLHVGESRWECRCGSGAAAHGSASTTAQLVPAASQAAAVLAMSPF